MVSVTFTVFVGSGVSVSLTVFVGSGVSVSLTVFVGSTAPSWATTGAFFESAEAPSNFAYLTSDSGKVRAPASITNPNVCCVGG